MRQLALTVMLLVPAVLPATPAAAQQRGAPLTLDRLFAGELAARSPDAVEWLADGGAYAVLESSTTDSGAQDLVRYDAATGRRSVLVPSARLKPPGATAPLTIEAYHWAPTGARVLIYTNSQKVWRQNTRGDYWLVDTASWTLRKLGPGAKPSTLMFATFSPDGRRIAYVRENNLWVEDVAAPNTVQLTTDGSPTVVNGTFDWVYEEELSLRHGFEWAPDSRRLAYWQLNMDSVRAFNLINNTDSLYSFVVPVQYPKAGTSNSAARIGVVSAGGGPTTWLAIPGDPRNHYLSRMDWAPDGREIAVQQLNRRQDTTVVWLGDAASGKARSVLTETDGAWVDPVNDFRWIDRGTSFVWFSERDGWRHLYAVSRDGSRMRPLTPGPFDLISPEASFGEPYVAGVDSVRGWIYFSASPDNATQQYLYRARLDGKGKPERITPRDQPGVHEYQIAPGARWAIHTYSRIDQPPRYELVRLPGHEPVRTLEDNAALRGRLAGMPLAPTEFVRLEAGPDLALDAWVMRPADFDSTRRYPVLFHVYGEPASQTVLDQWGGFLYGWHQVLAQHGYVVVSVDNRGTPAPRGREFRKAIHRRIGVVNAADQAGAARTLLRRPWVDSSRVAIWGWSGGGSTTLNVMFRYPSLYGTGMSVAPAPDLRLYDTIYQERYMGLPQTNAEDYRLGSPITFADSLRGNLLLVHGTGDDNVHYQGTERLANALIAANKRFTVMPYPNRTHCICEGGNTGRHLFALLTSYLVQHVPPGPR
ncbi:MAG TPA: S9 family peptidase [Gemmatimonadales bacterium]|nr:S9 family peptidase [Gemmatimonadales bacterium]